MWPAPAISAGPATAPSVAPPSSAWCLPYHPLPLRFGWQLPHPLPSPDLVHPPSPPSPSSPPPHPRRSLHRIRLLSLRRLCLRPLSASSSSKFPPEFPPISRRLASFSVSDPISAMTSLYVREPPEPAARFAGISVAFADLASAPSFSSISAGLKTVIVSLRGMTPPEPAARYDGFPDVLWLVLSVFCRWLLELRVEGLPQVVRHPVIFSPNMALLVLLDEQHEDLIFGALLCVAPVMEGWTGLSAGVEVFLGLLACWVDVVACSGTMLRAGEEVQLGLHECWVVVVASFWDVAACCFCFFSLSDLEFFSGWREGNAGFAGGRLLGFIRCFCPFQHVAGAFRWHVSRITGSGWLAAQSPEGRKCMQGDRAGIG